MKHVLYNRDFAAKTAICEVCGPVTIAPSGRTIAGVVKWRCKSKKVADRKAADLATPRPKRGKPHHKARSKLCVGCGYLAKDIRVMDVHHKDGNHANNDDDNLVSLCPTCHRETHLGLR